jgi:hypothetical protein
MHDGHTVKTPGTAHRMATDRGNSWRFRQQTDPVNQAPTGSPGTSANAPRHPRSGAACHRRPRRPGQPGAGGITLHRGRATGGGPGTIRIQQNTPMRADPAPKERSADSRTADTYTAPLRRLAIAPNSDRALGAPIGGRHLSTAAASWRGCRRLSAPRSRLGPGRRQGGRKVGRDSDLRGRPAGLPFPAAPWPSEDVDAELPGAFWHAAAGQLAGPAGRLTAAA